MQLLSFQTLGLNRICQWFPLNKNIVSTINTSKKPGISKRGNQVSLGNQYYISLVEIRSLVSLVSKGYVFTGEDRT